jgi:1-deoxy-D-xylulose-5-phosphate synthase
VDVTATPHALPIGRAEVLREGGDVALVGIGSMVLHAERAADALADAGISATVINARFVKPLDEALLLRLADEVGAIVTIEENAVAGGFGSGVTELLAAHDRRIPVRSLGVADHFFEQASQGRLRELAGLGVPDIVEAARHVMAERGSAPIPVEPSSIAS